MGKDPKETPANQKGESSDNHRPGCTFSPIEDRSEYDRRIESLNPEQQELVKQLTNFADLCKYFENRGERVDASFADAVSDAAGLSLEQRVVRIRKINQKLMEGVENDGEGPQLRH